VYVAGDVSRDVQLAIIAAAEGARAGLAINGWLLPAFRDRCRAQKRRRTRLGGSRPPARLRL